MLAAASSDDRPGAAIKPLCTMAGQPITLAQWRSFTPGGPYQPPYRR